MMPILYCLFFFFFNDTATTEIYTLSLHDALPILQYYKRALEVRPKDVDARTDMGICLYEMGMADDAIAQFRTSLSYDSRHWQTWLNLGIVALSSKNDVKTATDAFSKVEEINPGFKDLPMLKEALKKA